MSNRKESIKKSLGLTEYPWSSDDEETPSPVQSAPTTSRRPSDSHESRNSSTPGTSGVTSSIFPLRRTQAKLEQELFWSLITNDKRMMSTEPPRPSTSSYTPPQVRESIDLDSPVSNFQRIFAIKRLTRTLNPNRFNKTNCPNMSSLQRASCSPRRAAGGARTNTARRRPRPPLDYTRNTIIPAVMESEGASPPDDETESLEPSLLQANPDNNGNADEQENNDDDTAEVGIPEVEEVVEIDAETEDNQADEANDENQDQASADDDANEEIVPINVSDDAQVPRGIKRKREPHELEPCTGKEFNQSLLRLLECPVCLEWMEPPMSQCRRGHLVCGRCRARLAACPVCRTAFSSVRNRAMEAVAEMLRYPCRHGCGRETRLRRRGVHEANCAARRYRCPAPPCADRPPLALADLSHHFQTRHMSMLKVGRKHKFSMKVNTEQHDHWLVMAARELFHLRVDVDIRTWGVDVYVAYIGPKCNAAKYTYEVTVLGQHNDRKLVYTRATHSDLESSSLNVSRQDCFHLTLDQALNFLRFRNRHCVPDKFLDFTVEINKSEVAVVNTRGDSDS